MCSPSGRGGPTSQLGLSFPPCLLLTSNFYKPRYADSPRRLKNVSVVMEWLPYGAARVESLSAGMSKLGPVAMEQLRAVYKQLGGAPLPPSSMCTPPMQAALGSSF